MRKQRYLAWLIALCMLFGTSGVNAYAQESNNNDSSIGTNASASALLSGTTQETSSVTSSALDADTAWITYYVGGIVTAAQDPVGESSQNPFPTLKQAADIINAKAGGNYNIIIQGSTTENEPIEFGDSANNYNIAINGNCSYTQTSVSPGSISVTGSAVIMSAVTDNSLITVESNVSLILDGLAVSPDTPGLIIHGTNNATFPLLSINSGAALTLNMGAAVQDNQNISSSSQSADNYQSFCGGIYNAGIFNMMGGTISGNSSVSYGGGVYNAGIFQMDGGTIAGNSGLTGSGVYNIGTFNMNNGTVSGNYCKDGAVYNSGVFNLHGGSINSNDILSGSFGFGGIYNLNSFTMDGGYIENNKGNAVDNEGAFNMSGGFIRNNDMAGVNNFQGASFIMSGGEITGHSEYAVISNSTITLSGDAYIPYGGSTSCNNQIYLVNNSADIGINIEGTLSRTEDIYVRLNQYEEKTQVIYGNLTEQNLSNFTMADTHYRLDSIGAVEYIGGTITYYVDAVNGSDSNDGSEDTPFKTLDEALSMLATYTGVIILKSDITIDKRMFINGKITIKTDGTARTITQGISNGSTNPFVFWVNGTLTLGENTDASGGLLTIDSGGNSIVTKMIYNRGTVNLYSGVELKNNSYLEGIVYNTNGGAFHMYGGTISYSNGIVINNISGTVEMIGGTINGFLGDVTKNAVYNADGAKLTISGGTISDVQGDSVSAVINDGTMEWSAGNISEIKGFNSIGIYNNGILAISGGSINGKDGVISDGIYNTNAVTMTGGSIAGFTAVGSRGVVNLGKFTMSGGTITDNHTAIENCFSGQLELSGSVSIPAGQSGMNAVYLVNEDSIIVSGNQENNILVTLDWYREGIQVLTGDTSFVRANYNKFILDNSDFILTEAGYTEYTGEPVIYYVSQDGNDINEGTSSDNALQSIQTAVDKIIDKSGKGTIIICTDLSLSDGVYIAGNITIKGDGKGTHVISRYTDPTYVYQDNLFTVNGDGTLILGDKDKDGTETADNLIIDGNNHTCSGALVSNGGFLEIHNGIILRNNATSGDGGGVQNNGCFTMYDGRIAGMDANFGGGIYNSQFSAFTLIDGDITDNKSALGGGIYNDGGTVTISGGTIQNNSCMAEFGKGIMNTEGSALILEKDALIAENNDICLIRNETAVTIGNRLTGASPVAVFNTIDCDSSGSLYTKRNEIGDVVAKSSVNYQFTDEDLSKLMIAGTDYGINSNGAIAVKLQDSWFTLDLADPVCYDGTEKKPAVTVVDNPILKQGTDYLVSYSNNINAGTAAVQVTGIGKYCSTVTKTFTISKAADNNSTDTGAPSSTPASPTPSQDATPTPEPSDTSAEELVPMEGIDAEETVTVEQDKDIINAKIEIPVDVILSKADKESHSGEINLTIPVSSDNLEKLIHNSNAAGISIDVLVPDCVLDHENIDNTDIRLDSGLLKAAKESGKDITVTVKDQNGRVRYSWTFTGKNLSESDCDPVDLILSLEVKNAETNQKLARLLNSQSDKKGYASNSLVVGFAYHGDLPSQASVKIYVGNMGFKTGEKIYLYYYNQKTNRLESLPYSSGYQVDKDGYVTVNILHCSDYVIMPVKAKSCITTSLLEQISITPKKSTLYLDRTKNKSTTVKINLPGTLEVVEDSGKKDSSSAVGAVTVSYQSSNKKVAAVDSSGKITAKGTGTAKITVTFTLYNGKTKTEVVKITVKKSESKGKKV